MSTFYGLSYLTFCLPSLRVGNLICSFGLVATTDGYGRVLIVRSVSALAGLLVQARAQGL